MCYKIMTHSLHCDARPFISDGHRDHVNGFDAPVPCPCDPDPRIPPWLRCPDHGCCRAVRRAQFCDDSSRRCAKTPPFHFHRYEKAHTARTTWRRAPVLHPELYSCPPDRLAQHISTGWIYALLTLNYLAQIQEEVRGAASELEDAAANHGLLSPPLCPWRSPAVSELAKLISQRREIEGALCGLAGDAEYVRRGVFREYKGPEPEYVWRESCEVVD